MTGLYIHVPFCGRRCIYCDFFSTTLLHKRYHYVNVVRRELKTRRTDDKIATIYIGGGTPTMLAKEQLEKILACIHANYDVAQDAEITLEANPENVTRNMMQCMPINRLSMGVQSFNDARLRFLNRRHTAGQAKNAVWIAREMGIENISIDLMYGLPWQTLDEWRNDVEEALALRVPHLSAYALSYESGTVLHQMWEQGEVRKADEELSRAMYYHLCEAAEAAGYEHYEISNFALPGFHSRHNSSYWDGTPYLGFGPGAHSYDGKRLRRSNPNSISDWNKGQYDEEELSDNDLFNERIFLSLRTSRGLDIESLQQTFPQQTADIMPTLQRHIDAGRLVQHTPYVRLSREAIFTSDDIRSDLFAQNGK